MAYSITAPRCHVFLDTHVGECQHPPLAAFHMMDDLEILLLLFLFLPPSSHTLPHSLFFPPAGLWCHHELEHGNYYFLSGWRIYKLHKLEFEWRGGGRREEEEEEERKRRGSRFLNNNNKSDFLTLRSELEFYNSDNIYFNFKCSLYLNKKMDEWVNNSRCMKIKWKWIHISRYHSINSWICANQCFSHKYFKIKAPRRESIHTDTRGLLFLKQEWEKKSPLYSRPWHSVQI